MASVSNLMGQRLDGIGKEKPVKVNGGVSLNQIFYAADGIDNRRIPYSYFASANLNLSLFGWGVPLSFMLSNQSVTFQQPFNQFALRPTYKWATLHVGFTGMSFSPYTLGGHLFRGVGADLAPTDKLRISLMYGRLLRAVEPDTVAGSAVRPAFDRFGYGMKVTYGTPKAFVETILFRAADDTASIRAIPEDQSLLPEENLVVGLTGGKTVFDKVMLRAEWATSAITRDTRAEPTFNNNPWGMAGGLFTPRASSSYYNAWKANLTYQGDNYSLGLGYERIDPGYRTLGAYFFNNDLENVTVNAATSLFKGKVNFSGNIGSQRDDLNNTKISNMRRLVAATTVSVAPSPRFNMSVAYSTFQTFTNIRSQFVDINRLTPFDNLDTLNFTQLSRNATVTAMYMPGQSKERRQTVSLNLLVQDAADRQSGVPQNSGLRFYNFNTGYNLQLSQTGLSFSAAFNAALSEGAAQQSMQTLGPTMMVGKPFLNKKLRTMLSLSHNDSYANGALTARIMNGRLSGVISVRKKHNLEIGAVVMNRRNRNGNEQQPAAFTEFTGTVGYSYAF
jgi:hypothetical protein